VPSSAGSRATASRNDGLSDVVVVKSGASNDGSGREEPVSKSKLGKALL
jgi:hypothetical protein